MHLFERFYTRSWACLGILFVVCIAVNILFWDRFPRQSLRKSQIYSRLEDIFVGSTKNIPPDTVFKEVVHTVTPYVKVNGNVTEAVEKGIPMGKFNIRTTEQMPKVVGKVATTTTENTPKIVVTIPNKSSADTVKNNDYNFKYLINEPDICKHPPVLIIVVCTAVKNHFPRLGVRSTWGSPDILNRTNSKLVFLVGRVKSKLQQEKLENESRFHHDIVQADFVDSYQNLTLKSITLLNWVKTFCSGSKFVLKADDDMYVNIHNLNKAMSQIKRPKFILGHVFEGAKPIQDKRSKWYTPLKDFAEKVYPRYVSGTTYAMTTSAVSDLYTAALEIQPFWLEDIYVTGLLARRAGIPRFHNPQFHYESSPDTGCAFKNGITGHRYKLATLQKIHRELYSSNLTCT